MRRHQLHEPAGKTARRCRKAGTVSAAVTMGRGILYYLPSRVNTLCSCQPGVWRLRPPTRRS